MDALLVNNINSGTRMNVTQPFNILQIVTLLSPIFLISGIVSMSFIFQNFKGLIYLGFILACVTARRFVMEYSGAKPLSSVTDRCNLIQYSLYGNATFSTFIFAFTLAYIGVPMIQNGNINWFVLIGIALYGFIDIGLKKINGCINDDLTPEIFMNLLTGIGSGWLIVFLMMIGGSQKYLFFNEISSNNTEICTKPKKQTFKCAVYKNGELVDNVRA